MEYCTGSQPGHVRIFYEQTSSHADGITNPHLAPFLRPISGFLSARFIRTIDGQHFVVVEKSVGHENDLVLLPISERTIAAFRRYAKGTLVPKPEGQRVSHRTETFWVRNDLHTMRARRQGSVVLADSSRVDGILLPTLENGALPIVQPNGQVALIPVERVRWLQIRRSLLRQVMSTTIGKGVEGALTGATVGFMAGLFQEGFSVGEEMRLGAIVGGVVGLGFGFIDGVFSAEKSREYMIHPVASPDRLELRIVMAL